jgi:hypothetical protein
MSQIFQIVGALFVLAAFVLAQMRRLDSNSLSYLSMNVIGSLILAALAAVDHQWGFLLLEGVWALVSVWGIVSVLRGKEAKSH